MKPEEREFKDRIMRIMMDDAAAPKLKELVIKLLNENEESYLSVYDYLRANVQLSKNALQEVEDKEVEFLWLEMLPLIAKVKEYYIMRDDKTAIIQDLSRRIVQKLVLGETSVELRQKIVSYICSNLKRSLCPFPNEQCNIGFAACYNHTETLYFAEELEQINRDITQNFACKIYKSIGENEKYLKLRKYLLFSCDDYCDYAIFLWENGEKYRAINVAEEGIERGTESKMNIYEFLAMTAKHDKNHAKYIDYKFKSTVANLTLDRYLEFEKLCTEEERNAYFLRFRDYIVHAKEDEKIKIRMYRKEYRDVIATLEDYTVATPIVDPFKMSVAQQLEDLFPKEILEFYLRAIRKANTAARIFYIAIASASLGVRRLLLDVLREPQRWREYLCDLKFRNRFRPSFDEVFGKVFPEWKDVELPKPKEPTQRDPNYKPDYIRRAEEFWKLKFGPKEDAKKAEEQQESGKSDSMQPEDKSEGQEQRDEERPELVLEAESQSIVQDEQVTVETEEQIEAAGVQTQEETPLLDDSIGEPVQIEAAPPVMIESAPEQTQIEPIAVQTEAVVTEAVVEAVEETPAPATEVAETAVSQPELAEPIPVIELKDYTAPVPPVSFEPVLPQPEPIQQPLPELPPMDFGRKKKAKRTVFEYKPTPEELEMYRKMSEQAENKGDK